MSYLRRVDASTTADWPDLVDELDRWAAAGRVATLWWRDDDAVATTPALDALLRLAGEVPLGLAVIPALARTELAEALANAPHIAVLQHGWQHRNHARDGKKSEYPRGRPTAGVAAEIAAGRARLAALFGQRALPLFVPPWNRIAGEFLPALPQAGIRGLSTMASGDAVALPPGVALLDVHLDLIDWRGARGFVGTGAALGRLVGQLQAGRYGAVEAGRPVGILTHHLIQDDATAAFLARLVALTGCHKAVRWAGPGEFLQ